MATKVKPQTSKAAKKKPEKETKKAAKATFKISDEPYDHAMPKGFNFKDYKPLKKKNFTSEALYFEHRGFGALHQHEVFKAKAEEARKYGSTKERRQKRQYVKLTEKMAELKKQLTAQGIDVETLLKAATNES